MLKSLHLKNILLFFMTKKNEPPINKLTCKEYDELIMRVEAQNINAGGNNNTPDPPKFTYAQQQYEQDYDK